VITELLPIYFQLLVELLETVEKEKIMQFFSDYRLPFLATEQMICHSLIQIDLSNKNHELFIPLIYLLLSKSGFSSLNESERKEFVKLLQQRFPLFLFKIDLESSDDLKALSLIIQLISAKANYKLNKDKKPIILRTEITYSLEDLQKEEGERKERVKLLEAIQLLKNSFDLNEQKDLKMLESLLLFYLNRHPMIEKETGSLWLNLYNDFLENKQLDHALNRLEELDHFQLYSESERFKLCFQLILQGSKNERLFSLAQKLFSSFILKSNPLSIVDLNCLITVLKFFESKTTNKTDSFVLIPLKNLISKDNQSEIVQSKLLLFIQLKKETMAIEKPAEWEELERLLNFYRAYFPNFNEELMEIWALLLDFFLKNKLQNLAIKRLNEVIDSDLSENEKLDFSINSLEKLKISHDLLPIIDRGITAALKQKNSKKLLQLIFLGNQIIDLLNGVQESLSKSHIEYLSRNDFAAFILKEKNPKLSGIVQLIGFLSLASKYLGSRGDHFEERLPFFSKILRILDSEKNYQNDQAVTLSNWLLSEQHFLESLIARARGEYQSRGYSPDCQNMQKLIERSLLLFKKAIKNIINIDIEVFSAYSIFLQTIANGVKLAQIKNHSAHIIAKTLFLLCSKWIQSSKEKITFELFDKAVKILNSFKMEGNDQIFDPYTRSRHKSYLYMARHILLLIGSTGLKRSLEYLQIIDEEISTQLDNASKKTIEKLSEKKQKKEAGTRGLN
jgi:hypothetical protein